jgi:hypothetical protein
VGGAFQTNMGGVTQGAVASYTSGAAMDAAAVVGGTYRLVGATTGAEIALMECVTVSPVTYRMRGNARWYQATGTEFDGVFRWVAVGTGGAITWGATPGSRTDGGLKHGGTGTIELQGLELQAGAIGTHTAQVYIQAWDTAPATGRCLLFGWTRPGVSTLIYGGGVGYTTTFLRTAAVAGQARDAPTITVGVTNVTATAAAEWAIKGFKYPNTPNNTTAAGSAFTGAAATAPAGANGVSINGTTDSRPSITKVGDTNAFILETSFAIAGAT